MAELIKDPDEIRRLAESRRDENFDFRSFLKGRLNWSDERLDRLVHEILKSVTAEIDCKECAHCCRVMGTGVDAEDIERIARRLGMSSEEFREKYVVRGEWGEDIIDQKPCPFLDGNMCSIWEDCPKDCREYPHLHLEDVRSRSLSFLENAEVCPIAFNTLELLKARFRRSYWA